MASSLMEEVRSAMSEHADLVSEMFEKLSSELRSGFRPAYDNLIGFFHAINWKEPWLICLMLFHACFFLVAILSRRNVNFQLCLSILAFSGVFLAERINTVLARNWKSFATQNYFDPYGLFISAVWSGPLLFISMVIVVNALITLCYLMVRWKKAELRHRARIARSKQD